MLPTTGFFKNIDCPYYETTCDRPYCHFKHRKKNDEPVELPASTEIPTYNPTPKSQLANARSHIPITYVPDLAIRKEPHKPRSKSSYGYSDQQPTYKPTPLSILSTGKLTATEVEKEEVDDEIPTRCSPTNDDDANNIDFEDLQMEFSLIDELIGESSVNDDEDTKSKVKEDHKIKTKSSESKHLSSTSKSKEDKKKRNGHLNDSKNSKSHSNNKSKSDHKKESKTDLKHKKSSRKDRDEKHRKETKEKSKSESKKKSESKDKSRKHKSSSSNDKHKHQHTSATKDKSKDRDKSKTRRSKDIKQEEKKAVDLEEAVINKYTSQQVEDKLDDFDEQNEIHDDGGYDNYLNDSDLEEDPMEECYKIFTEYKPTEPKIFPDLNQQLQSIPDTSDAALTNRKRIAHDSAQNVRQDVIFNRLKPIPSAAQVMANRLKMVRLQYNAQEQKQDVVAEITRHLSKRRIEEPTGHDNNKKQKLSNHVSTKSTSSERVSHSKLPSSSTNLVDDIISGGKLTNIKRKIAPVQNVNSIQREKAKLNEIARIRAQNIICKTASQTIKHAKRVAHVPDVSVVDIPEVQETERSKLPINVRNNFLKLIFQECTKLYLSKDEAQQRAVSEEYKCYERCSAIVTYRNSAMLAISRLRKELQTRDSSGLGPIMPGECPDDKQNHDDLSGEKFYETIKRFVLNDEELTLHGFPREGSVHGRAIVKNQRRTSQVHCQEDERVCCRCSKHYRVDKEGFALYPEDCLYHPLKKRTLRGESIYLCCKSSYDMGCVTSSTHVSDNRSSDDELEGYQVIMPPERENDPRSYQVFALDCEMCYTTKGLELTRVTIINTDCKTVYESLVKPLNPIIDYNTRFSGITEDQMERTATSILQVQANILHLCNSNTILIGHSLESDLKALKIIHSCIIDTSVLFPHKFGLPHKRALRDLAREYLKKIIQNDVSGHDSAEDALTCMELIKWKLKEDFKARGIKVS